VMEEFGLGDSSIVRALSPVPGLGGTGRTCGAVSAGLVLLGLHFGSDGLQNYESNRQAVMAARVFLQRFEETFGSLECQDIQTLLLGRYFDPKGGKESSEGFVKAKGFEKCTVAAGVGATPAAEIMIDSMGG
jgi:C_GCAxxG_C_C family probable redox protein